MPRVVNPNAVASSLPGRILAVKATTADIKGKARNAFASLVVGLGGLIVNGATQLVGGITGGLSITGNLSVGGNITATGSNTVTATAVVGSDLYTLNGPAFNITGTRVAAWLESATGRVGMAVSARRFKQNISPKRYSLQQLLAIQLVTYRFISAVEEFGDAAALEVGVIAEQLVDAGLSEFVVFIDGEPLSVHYDRLALVAIGALHDIATRLDTVEQRLESAGL